MRPKPVKLPASGIHKSVDHRHGTGLQSTGSPEHAGGLQRIELRRSKAALPEKDGGFRQLGYCGFPDSACKVPWLKRCRTCRDQCPQRRLLRSLNSRDSTSPERVGRSLGVFVETNPKGFRCRPFGKQLPPKKRGGIGPQHACHLSCLKLLTQVQTLGNLKDGGCRQPTVLVERSAQPPSRVGQVLSLRF